MRALTHTIKQPAPQHPAHPVRVGSKQQLLVEEDQQAVQEKLIRL